MLKLKVIRKDVGTFRVPRVRFLSSFPTHLSHLYLSEGAVHEHKSEKRARYAVTSSSRLIMRCNISNHRLHFNETKSPPSRATPSPLRSLFSPLPTSLCCFYLSSSSCSMFHRRPTSRQSVWSVRRRGEKKPAHDPMKEMKLKTRQTTTTNAACCMFCGYNEFVNR